MAKTHTITEPKFLKTDKTWEWSCTCGVRCWGVSEKNVRSNHALHVTQKNAVSASGGARAADRARKAAKRASA